MLIAAPQPEAVTGADLALLTGPDVEDLLRAAGGELVGWRVRQIDHRPGASVTASYSARVCWSDREQDETVGASTGIAAPADRPPVLGVIDLSDGEREVAVWRYPLGPGLPGLAAACDPAAVAALLTRFGAPARAEDVRLTTRAHRPRRRAVVQADVPGGRLFLKVLRPHRVQDLHARHRLLHGTGQPVPRAALDLPRRRSWTEGAANYASVLGHALPDRVRHLAAAIRAATVERAPRLPPLRPDWLADTRLRVDAVERSPDGRP